MNVYWIRYKQITKLNRNNIDDMIQLISFISQHIQGFIYFIILSAMSCRPSNLLFKILFFFSSFILQAFTLHCQPACTYSYNSGGINIVPQCSSSATNDCLQCDPRFYLLATNSKSCTPPPTSPSYSIYNKTIRVTQPDWDKPNSNIGNKNHEGDQYIQLTGNAIVSKDLNHTSAHYGYRCRISMYFATNGLGSTFNPKIYFKVSNGLSELVDMQPLNNANYNIEYFIYSSPFIASTDPYFRIYIERNDSQNMNGNDQFSFNQAICYIAECVVGCLSCTSLSDCSQCSANLYLDPVTHYCTATCRDGTFANPTTMLCELCDPKCDNCTTTATTCTNCVNQGPFESFLDGTSCVFNCTTLYLVKDYHTHTCICPTENYTIVANVCTTCIINCKYCSQSTITLCDKCVLGYYLRVSKAACLTACPVGEYADLIFQLGVCYTCNLLSCTQCVNTSTTCTKCNFPTNDRYLSNFACVYVCPDGYEGNNQTFVCNQCLLGTYSFENVCYSQCPQFYVANDDIRACVLPGGYPLNLTIHVQTQDTLRFYIQLPLGLLTSNNSLLNTSWSSMISMFFITQTQNKLLLNSRRLLQYVYAPRSMTIKNAIITNKSITLYSSTISASDLINTHSFVVRFSDNIYSPRNVMYSITSKNSTDNNPWFVSQYYELNIKPFYLIGIFLAAFGLIIILMRTKYVYRILIEYIHCIQLLGLTFYSIYPHSAQLYLYSFVKGLDFANFSFIINIPATFITPCYDCKSLVSFSFAIGDMNWLRMMGSLLLCIIIMLLFCLLIYLFKCSRMYAQFYIYLVIDLVLIKTIHGWFSSLLYSGLNFKYNTLDYDMYVLGVHLLSYLLLTPILYKRIKTQYEKKFLNISFISLLIFIILLTLLSLAPTLICALLLLLTSVEWALINGLNITEQEIPEVKKEDLQNLQSSNNSEVIEQPQRPLAISFNHYLLRSIKPLTAFLVACIIMIENQIVPIVLVSTVIFLLLLLIIVDAYLMYEYHDELEKKESMEAKPPRSKQIMNETKQDLNLREKQTEYKEINVSQAERGFKNFDDNDDADDDIVANKFRKNRGSVAVKPYNLNQDFLIKNID